MKYKNASITKRYVTENDCVIRAEEDDCVGFLISSFETDTMEYFFLTVDQIPVIGEVLECLQMLQKAKNTLSPSE